jgi:hypothetical protein
LKNLRLYKQISTHQLRFELSCSTCFVYWISNNFFFRWWWWSTLLKWYLQFLLKGEVYWLTPLQAFYYAHRQKCCLLIFFYALYICNVQNIVMLSFSACVCALLLLVANYGCLYLVHLHSHTIGMTQPCIEWRSHVRASGPCPYKPFIYIKGKYWTWPWTWSHTCHFFFKKKKKKTFKRLYIVREQSSFLWWVI